VLGRLGGGAVETLELALVKGFSGLGLDLVPRADGAVLVTIVRPYVSGPPAGAGAEEVASPPHPADQAKPSPLLDGDEIVAVNGKRFEGDFSACKSLIRTAPEHVKLTICRPRKNDADAAPDAKSSSSGIDDNAPLVVGKSLEEWNVALGATSVFVSAYLVEVSFFCHRPRWCSVLSIILQAKQCITFLFFFVTSHTATSVEFSC